MEDLSIKYNQLWSDFTNHLPNSNYIFEVTKCCNYSTFVLCSKKGTLIDLYSAVSRHFECPDIKQLYILNVTTNEKITIPVTDNKKIREFIINNVALFKPIYPVPHPVVYRIYLDDGHVHEHTHT